MVFDATPSEPAAQVLSIRYLHASRGGAPSSGSQGPLEALPARTIEILY